MRAQQLLFRRHLLPSFAALLFVSLSAGLAGTPRPASERMGHVVDWTTRHVLYPQGASLRALAIGQRDPRAYWNYMRLVQASNALQISAALRRGPRRPVRPLPHHVDWSVSLGAAGAAPNMFPAKFSFYVNAAPDCTNDYIVFPINANATAAQANIAAFNNLYSGAGSPASCFTSIAASPGGATEAGTTVTITTTAAHGYSVNETVVVSGVAVAGYNGTWRVTAVPTATTFTYTVGLAGLPNSGGGMASGPTVTWAYQAGAGTSRIRTSPVLSQDGAKVAFVDGNNPANFHVLTPTAGQGTVTAPATPTAAQLVTVALTTGADSNSSPFVDYFNDIAYVGTNNGRIFKITGVFKGTPTLAGAPWPLTAGATTLTEPVIDFNNGNIFVGSANGNLYGFTSVGAAIPNSPTAIGSGRATGGIADAPIIDEMNGLIYVATGDNAARANAVVAQTGTSNFSTVRTAPIGTTNVAPIHSGTFNDAYFTVSTNMIGTTSEWFFYVCGVATGGPTSPVLYRVGFTGTPPQLNAAADATNVSLSANNGEQCSPLTELKNGVDRIFLGLRTSAQVEFFDISTTTTPTLGGTGGVAPVPEAGGTSGIIIDNVSNIAQASSIYFSTITNSANCGAHRCAVKLTQGGLQ